MPPFFKCQAVENQLGKLFFEKLHFEMSDNLDIKSGLVAKHSDLEKLAWKIYPDQNGSFLWRMLQKIIHFFVQGSNRCFSNSFSFLYPRKCNAENVFQTSRVDTTWYTILRPGFFCSLVLLVIKATKNLTPLAYDVTISPQSKWRHQILQCDRMSDFNLSRRYGSKNVHGMSIFKKMP